MNKIKLYLILLILLIDANLIISQKNEVFTPPKIEWELIDHFDSLIHNPIGFENYLISKESHIPTKSIPFFISNSQTIDNFINEISTNFNYLSYLIGVDDEGYIKGILIDNFYDLKNTLRIYICLHTPVMSCCGWGGEFNVYNTLIPDVRNKNLELIKDIKEYSVFQYLVPIPESYYFEDENQKLDSLKKEYIKRYKNKKR